MDVKLTAQSKAEYSSTDVHIYNRILHEWLNVHVASNNIGEQQLFDTRVNYDICLYRRLWSTTKALLCEARENWSFRWRGEEADIIASVGTRLQRNTTSCSYALIHVDTTSHLCRQTHSSSHSDTSELCAYVIWCWAHQLWDGWTAVGQETIMLCNYNVSDVKYSPMHCSGGFSINYNL